VEGQTGNPDGLVPEPHSGSEATWGGAWGGWKQRPRRQEVARGRQLPGAAHHRPFAQVGSVHLNVTVLQDPQVGKLILVTSSQGAPKVNIHCQHEQPPGPLALPHWNAQLSSVWPEF